VTYSGYRISFPSARRSAGLLYGACRRRAAVRGLPLRPTGMPNAERGSHLRRRRAKQRISTLRCARADLTLSFVSRFEFTNLTAAHQWAELRKFLKVRFVHGEKCYRRSDSVMLHDSDQTVAVRLFFNGGSEVFRKLRTPGSLKLNIKVRGRDQKLEAEAKGSRGQGQRLRGRGQNFGLEAEALTSLGKDKISFVRVK